MNATSIDGDKCIISIICGCYTSQVSNPGSGQGQATGQMSSGEVLSYSSNQF